MGIFHNVKGLQAGRYRGKPYPENQIRAQLNYLFASREMMREMGFAESAESLDGIINLYGFETNYPNGHVDYPPHFHIMTMWDAWQYIQACHFILDANGKILRNDHFVVEKGKTIHDRCTEDPLGSTIALTDRSGKVRFMLRMLEDGTGLEMSVPGQSKEAKICSSNAVDSVGCWTRENSQSPWKEASVSRVEDDSRRGVLTVWTTCNGQTETESWNYDPNTGTLKTEQK